MTSFEIDQQESENEDGDRDQFDLGTSFDNLETGYFLKTRHTYPLIYN